MTRFITAVHRDAPTRLATGLYDDMNFTNHLVHMAEIFVYLNSSRNQRTPEARGMSIMHSGNIVNPIPVMQVAAPGYSNVAVRTRESLRDEDLNWRSTNTAAILPIGAP